MKLRIDFEDIISTDEDIISTDEYLIKNSYVNIKEKNNNFGIFYFPYSKEENEIISGDTERKIYNMNTKINFFIFIKDLYINSYETLIYQII